MTVHRSHGGCHCGNLTYTLSTGLPLETRGLRADMCSFCRAHGARNTADPDGSVSIAVRDSGKLLRYRFALRTADFLICADCGVYIGAMLTEGGRSWFSINANSFNEPPALDFPIAPVNYDGEDAATRIARRKAAWTPVLEFTA